jgi:general secretion pathway protein G
MLRHIRHRRQGPGSRCARGLTLIEIAVALSVVAVLAALALPLIDGWRDKIKVKQATDDLMALSLVIDAFHLDSDRFPASLAEIQRAGLKDPWGNAYVYLVLSSPQAIGQARKDHALVPLNTDYDLYSKGADGQSMAPLTAKASRDDILRANNGRFFGLASKY